MEINSSFHPPVPYPVAGPKPEHALDNPLQGQQAQDRPAPAAISQTVKSEQHNYAQKQKRFYSSAQDLSHTSRRAINQYIDADDAGGPELMNRVDVYA